MEITDFGFFTVRPVRTGEPVLLYFESEDGYDWYDIRAGLTQWRLEDGEFVNAVYGAWASVDALGIVQNVEYDPSRIVPNDRRVLGIDADCADVRPGMIYRDGQLLPPDEEDAA